MKRILISLASVAAVAGIGVFATNAFFSDTETSHANTFVAGKVDLKVDSECHYFTLDPTKEETYTDKRCVDVNGAPFGVWQSSDLTDQRFFSFSDVKPGDYGENTISLTVDNNPSWACMHIGNMKNLENTCIDPETKAGDISCGPGPDQGELAQNLNFTAWLDQGNTPGWQGKGVDPGEGDNKWDGPQKEPLMFKNEQGPASDVLSGKTYPIADASTLGNPLEGQQTNYIGLEWCAGKMTISGSTISCDGSVMGNNTQTDSLSADLSFYVVQSRNNPNFVCSDDVFPTPTQNPV